MRISIGLLAIRWTLFVKVLGMDSEWITEEKRRKPISMLQLSTLNCTALVRIHLLEALQHIPSSLIELMEDKRYCKLLLFCHCSFEIML